MKKLISILLLLALFALPLTACKKPEPEALRVGYMSGPTGIGMAKLIHDNGGKDGNDKYTFEAFADTATAAAALLSGKIDVICLPTNEAAKNFNTTNPDSRVLALNCLNSLYLLTDSSYNITSFEELEGKTIYTCKNGTPSIILKHALEQAGINATVAYEIGEQTITKPQDIGPLLNAGKIDIAVAPEPIVTASLLNIQNNENAVRRYSVLDLDTLWSGISDTPVAMGCVVASTAAISKSADRIDSFLDEYEASVAFISNSENINSAADYIVECGIMQAVGAAEKALTNLGDAICYVDGAEMKETLIAFYEVLGLQVIGGKLPDESFYYIP
ncbi:MAG: ABC transporter substrate-binding protein [Clostridia bacterium]|nr:ABC transporter substrate-binding protein [Clostridia bacterium]